MNFIVTILLLLVTIEAGCSKIKKPITQCRVEVGIPGGVLGDIVDGEWGDCKTAEKAADTVYDQFPIPGAGVWTEEQTQIDKKKWTVPKKHTEVRVIPDDFTNDWDSI